MVRREPADIREWTSAGLPERSDPSTADGDPACYQMDTHDGARSEWTCPKKACQSGWYRRSLPAFVPMRDESRFYFRGVGQLF